MTRQELETLYDRLCAIADGIFEKYDICKIKTEDDGLVTCTGGYTCCTGESENMLCEHMGPDGCTIQCLMCKVYICFRAGRVEPLAKHQLKRLGKIAKKYGLLFYYTSREEAIDKACKLLGIKD